MKQWNTSIKHYTNKTDHTHVVLHTVMGHAIKKHIHTYITYIQGVTGGKDQTSGGCSLC